MTVDTALAAAERLGHVGDIYVRFKFTDSYIFSSVMCLHIAEFYVCFHLFLALDD